MYENNFRQILASKNLANSYLIYGACKLSITVLASKILQIYEPDVSLKMSSTDFKLNKAVEFLKSFDLFYSKKVLILELEQDDLRSFNLSELHKSAKEDARLLVLAHTSAAQKASEKAFGNDFVRVFEKSQELEQLNLLQDYAQILQVKAARSDLIKLANCYSHDIFLAGCELLKFKNQQFDLERCDLIGSDLEEFDALFDALFLPTFNLSGFENMLQNEEAISLINKLNGNFLRLFKLSAYAKTHAQIDFSVALGYSPPTQIRNKLEHFSRLCEDKYEEIFKVLINALEKITLESLDSQSILLSTLIKIKLIIN